MTLDEDKIRKIVAVISGLCGALIAVLNIMDLMRKK